MSLPAAGLVLVYDIEVAAVCPAIACEILCFSRANSLIFVARRSTFPL